MFSGSLVAIVTPMHPDGAVDFEAWARLLDFHAANGTQGIVVGGTTSGPYRRGNWAGSRAAAARLCRCRDSSGVN